jgi:hypothetical protein
LEEDREDQMNEFEIDQGAEERKKVGTRQDARYYSELG